MKRILLCVAAVLTAGQADAALAASIFHYGRYTVGQVKRELAARLLDRITEKNKAEL